MILSEVRVLSSLFVVFLLLGSFLVLLGGSWGALRVYFRWTGPPVYKIFVDRASCLQNVL